MILDAMKTGSETIDTLATKCIVCSESVPLTQLEEKMVCYGMTIGSKVCGKCKQAILYIRERIEREAQEGI